MKRLMKILFGLSIGAAVAVLFAPKSGRELREQLIGGATGKLLPAAPVEFPEPEGERLWDAGTATAVAQPTVVEPAFEEPGIVEEAAVVVEEEAVEEVAAVEPEVVEEVTAAEPEVAEETAFEDLRARIEETRAAVETDIAQPFASVATEAVVEEAAADEAVVEEAVSEEPVLEGPEYQEPVGSAEPDVVVEAPAEEPRAWELAYDKEESPAVEQPQTEAPVAEEPAAETPVSEEPIAEEAPVSEAAEGLVADITSSPVAAVAEEAPAEAVAQVEEIEVAAVEEVPAEELVVEEPVVEEPVAEEEPSAREGGTINQAEMRRRIEETRARLKAKAFDAMMSGESALLSRDSGEKPLPKGDDVKLDGELESTLDESLSQEEY
jgi:hypothetical protein